jgi:glycine/D-amino acid oxidase-like deaminating enzyme
MRGADCLVIGGGLVGAAIAYGLARRGVSTVIIDEGDVAFRASRGNFGLVWVQGKGDGMPDYAAWTRLSADLWPHFSESLREATGIGTVYTKRGGFFLCRSEAELAEQEARLQRIRSLNTAPGPDYEVLDHKALAARLPGLGPAVVGGTYCPDDGHCNPLYLLRALHAGHAALGGRYLPNRRVAEIRPEAGGFTVLTEGGEIRGDRVVLAAGLGSARLAPALGLSVPVVPQRGQVLVTQRTAPRLAFPTVYVRQTGEGSFLLGDSHEDVGFDEGTTAEAMTEIARRALDFFPFLAALPVVRVWGALRVMTPDGFPVYDQSCEHPGAFSAACHSGVTLAAAHVERLAGVIAEGALPAAFREFSADRFNVQKAA